MQPKMADLPVERSCDAPPFTYTGVDMFGPFVVKRGRKTEKRYGAIFTCLASRAVHIEVCHSLETDSFIQAFRRFTACRGHVSQLRCDNGTNFRGAERELRNALHEMNDGDLAQRLRKLDVEFIFNPPCASNFGGIWERQIRSVRRVMSGLPSQSVLDDEALTTLFCEIEAIVNSRPLTTPSSDASDLCPLTPNTVLTQKSSTFLPPPGVFQRDDLYCRKRWRRVQFLADAFWNRWRKEYLVALQRRSKWNQPERSPRLGDIVLVKDENQHRNCWTLAKIVECFPSDDGIVRSVEIKTMNGVLKRPTNGLVLLVPVEEQ